MRHQCLDPAWTARDGREGQVEMRMVIRYRQVRWATECNEEVHRSQWAHSTHTARAAEEGVQEAMDRREATTALLLAVDMAVEEVIEVVRRLQDGMEEVEAATDLRLQACAVHRCRSQDLDLHLATRTTIADSTPVVLQLLWVLGQPELQCITKDPLPHQSNLRMW